MKNILANSQSALTHLKLRQELIRTARRMNALGINQGTSGNVSVRIESGLLITPSGVPYKEIQPADIVEMDLDGHWYCARPERRPSSEWRFHRDILRARPEFGAVLHSHALYATTLSCHHRDIPAFHYMVAVAGGDSIRCAPYATSAVRSYRSTCSRRLPSVVLVYSPIMASSLPVGISKPH